MKKGGNLTKNDTVAKSIDVLHFEMVGTLEKFFEVALSILKNDVYFVECIGVLRLKNLDNIHDSFVFESSKEGDFP